MKNEERIKFKAYAPTITETPTGFTYVYEGGDIEEDISEFEFDDEEESDSSESSIPSKHDRVVQLMDVED